MTEATVPDRSETQRAVLDATLELMKEGGEPNVRVAEVARRAGVTTGAIYSNFDSREGLVAAAHIAHMEQELGRHLTARMRADAAHEGDPRYDAEWSAVAREIFDQPGRERRRRWAEAALTAHRSPDLEQAMVPIAREALGHLVEEIRIAQANGWQHADLDPHAMAVFMVGSTLGVALLAGAYSNDDPDFTDKLLACWPYISTAFLTDQAGRTPGDFSV